MSRRTPGCWASGWRSAPIRSVSVAFALLAKMLIKLLLDRLIDLVGVTKQIGVVVEQFLGLSFHGRSST